MADSDVVLHKTSLANTSIILSPSSGSSVLSANQYRGGFMIQNLSTNPLYVSLGTTVGAQTFHIVLKGSTSQDDGTGGTVSMEAGTVYTGQIMVYGTSPRCVVSEFN